MPVTQKCRKGTSEWGMSGSANLRKWRVIMKNKKIVQKAGSRFLAMMLSVAMVVPGTAFVPAEYSGGTSAFRTYAELAYICL